MDTPSPFAATTPLTEYRNFVMDNRRWEHFRGRPGDIFVCTPPKCGTTWTQMIVASLLFQDGAFPAPVMHLAPWFDARFAPVTDVAAALESQTHRRSIKTHTPADGIPWDPGARYVVVGRDGRDAFMSFVNHMASMRPDKVAELIASAAAEGIPAGVPPPPPENIHEFFAYWLETGDFFTFLMSYWRLRDEPNVLFVHYDDLKQDMEKEIRRIAAFLKTPIDESSMPGILERCSFQWMRSNADCIGEFGELFVGGAESFFFKGTNNRWRDVLTTEELAAYDRRSRELLAADLKSWLDRRDREG